MLNIWSDEAGTVYVQWGDTGSIRWIAEDGTTGERFTLPAGASQMTRPRQSYIWDPQAKGWMVA